MSNLTICETLDPLWALELSTPNQTMMALLVSSIGALEPGTLLTDSRAMSSVFVINASRVVDVTPRMKHYYVCYATIRLASLTFSTFVCLAFTDFLFKLLC
jgi:hypothetical protein